jgi:hypothetical protein
MYARRAGLPLILVLRPSQLFRPMVGDFYFYFFQPLGQMPTNHWYKGRHLTLEDVSNFVVLDEDIHLYCVLCPLLVRR